MRRAATQMYSCPVCGTELAQSDFEEPPESYYCPFCTSRRTPLRVDLAEVPMKQIGSVGAVSLQA